MKSWRVLFFLMAAVLAACSEEPIDNDEGASETEQAVLVGTWDAPICAAQSDNPPGLERPPNTCAGPWTYRMRTPTSAADSHCPEVWRQCRAWSHGYEFASMPGENPSGSLVRTCSRRCALGSTTSCQPAVCTPSNQTPQAFCQQKATNRRAQLVDSVPTSAPGYDHANIQSHTTVTATANPVVSNQWVDLGDEQQDYDLYGWTETTTCSLSIPSAPRGKLARSSVCGQEGWQSCPHFHDGGPVITAPMVPKPTDVFDPPGPEQPVPPKCTTCDDVALVNGASAKYQCLDYNLSLYFTNTTMRQALSARLKLLLAVAGDQLQSYQRGNIFYYYGDRVHFTDQLTCEADPLPIAQSCLSPQAGLYGQLVACRSLGQAHATAGSAAAMFNACVALTDDIASMPTGQPECRDQYAEAVADILEALADKALGTIGSASPTELIETLRRADALYGALDVLSGGDPAWLRGRTSPVIKRVLEAIYAARYPYPTTPFGNNQQDAALDFTVLAADEGRASDAELIHTLFTASPAPVASPLLVALLSDGLSATAKHAGVLTEIHDVACRYRGCGPSDRSPVLDFWRIVAALPDATQLGQAIAGANELAADSPELFQAFVAIRDNHARLAAVLPLPDDGGVPPEALPAGGEELLQLVAQGRRYTESFAETGILVDGGQYPLLETVPHRETEARGLLNERLGGLREELNDLGSSRVALVNALLQQLQNGQDSSALAAQLQIMRQRILAAGDRYGGLVARQRDQRESYAGVLAGFEAMLASGALSPDEVIDVQTYPAFTLSGGDARFDGLHDGENILVLAAPSSGPVWKTELRIGEQLRFNVAGSWSPTCALDDVSFEFPDGAGWVIPQADLATAWTGPEGFAIRFGDQKLTAGSTRSNLDSFEQCLDPSLVGQPGSIREAAQTRSCVDWERQSTHESTRALNVSAQFEAGIRIESTPFPNAPAGSLLAVLTEHGTLTIADVQVVHRETAILAPRRNGNPALSYDVYLVVNDRGTCTPVGGSLSILASKTVPLGPAAAGLGQAMDAVLRDTEAQVPAIIRQGAFAASEQTAMKSMAIVNLENAAGMPLDQVPAIRGLFSAWVDMQIASIDRRAQIADVDRSLAELALQAQAIEHDLRWAGDRARLLTLLPRWNLRNLDQEALKADLRGVFLSLGADIMPMFTLRHPVSLAAFRATQEFANEMIALMDTGFGDRVEDAAERLADFGDHVSQALLSAANNNPVTTEKIILAYPTPEQCAAGCTLNPFGRTEFDGLRVPSQGAIMAVWQSLRATRTAVLSIGAADAYEAVGEASRLSCGDHAPIIRRIALVADLSGDSNPLWGALGYASGAAGNVENRYPTAVGELVYRMPPFWEDFELPLASVIDVGQLSADAYPYLSDVGAGLSPVNDFSIELAGLTNLEFNRVQALYLVMEVDKQDTAPQVLIPGVCELP